MIKTFYGDLRYIFLLCSVIMCVIILAGKQMLDLSLVKLNQNQLKSSLLRLRRLQTITWLQEQDQTKLGGQAKTFFEGFYQVYIGSQQKKRKIEFGGKLERKGFGEEEESKKLIGGGQTEGSYHLGSYSTLSFNQYTSDSRNYQKMIKVAEYVTEEYIKAIRR